MQSGDNALPGSSILPESLFIQPSWCFHCAGKHIKRLSADPLARSKSRMYFQIPTINFSLVFFLLVFKEPVDLLKKILNVNSWINIRLQTQVPKLKQCPNLLVIGGPQPATHIWEAAALKVKESAIVFRAAQLLCQQNTRGFL